MVNKLCVCCDAHDKLEALARLANEAGGEVRDIEYMKGLFVGSQTAPVKKGLHYKKRLFFTKKYSNKNDDQLVVELSIKDALEPDRLKRALNPTPKKVKAVKAAPYAKPYVLNREEVEAARRDAKTYNRAIKEGRQATPPTLPKILLSATPKDNDKWFLVLSNSMKAQTDFELLTKAGQVFGPESVVALKHSVCGHQSFFRIDGLNSRIRKGREILCQRRECYELASGVKLAKASALPSREGISPITKIVDLGRIVEEQSEGSLSPVGEPRDVRSSFVVRVNVGDSKGATFEISSHDNWSRRGTYRRASMAARGEGSWPSRLKWLRR